ncbi:hypothetical protein [Micromonospora sp. NPDC049282]|uniref:hypothetical protein n=1 Tax=Micromonospora sp. NPDC049282 TaxID=3364269 RepID=UPI00371B6ADE
MRRVFAVTALAGLLLAGSGCAGRNDDPFSVGFASPAPAGTSPTPAPTATGDAGVCARAKQSGSVAVQTYVQKLAEMLRAGGTGDRSTEKAAQRDAEAALTGWRDVLREQSGKATDPRLRTLLADLATEVGGLGTDVRAIDETEFDRLQQRLDQLCPA